MKNVLTIECWQELTTLHELSSAPTPTLKEGERKQTQVPLLGFFRPQILAITTKAFVISCHKEDNAESSIYLRGI